MYIENLTLSRYKRLFLAYINKLEYTPEKRINIIVGKNGSGKSSTLKELTPLPANLTKDYDEDGYKKITIKHKGSKYVLTSGIVGKNKHSFMVDNEELNPAGTRKVQLMLVKEHFNLTQDIHDTLIGLKNFTSMSTVERKNWFTNISTVDYTYAIGVYNKIKQRHRDIVGALKISQTELTKGSDSIKTEEEINSIKGEIKILKEILDLAMSSKEQFRSPVDIDETKLMMLVDMGYKVLSELNKPDLDVDIDVAIGSISNEITLLKNEIEKQNKILKDLMFMEDTKDSSDAKLIDETILELQKKISTLEDSFIVKIPRDDLPEFINSFNYRYQDIIVILNEISIRNDADYDIDLYKKNLTDIDVINANINTFVNLRETLFKTKDSMEHNRDHNEVECVKCGNIWSIGYDEKEYKIVIDKIDKLSVKIEKLKKRLDELNEVVSTFKEKITYTKQLLSIKDNETNLYNKQVLEHVLDKYNVLTESKAIIDYMYKVKNNVAELEKIPIYVKEYEMHLKDKEILEVKRKMEVEYFNTNKDNIEEELSNNKVRLKELDNKLNSVKSYKSNLSILTKISDTLIDSIKKLNSNKQVEISMARNNSLNESIKVINLEISKLESIISDSLYNSKLIENNKEKVIELDKRKKATALLLEVMSPNNGLIAKSITQFLDMFINDMNSIINKVWNYSIDVLPCKIDDGVDLDYKFEVRVDGRNVMEDVSKTSSSMKEIINLAFKIVSMKYLNMEDYPLYLDEYAASFDAHHAIKAYDGIETLASSSFNQIFMISHYESTYTRFSDCDISVLDAENILLNGDMEINRVLKLS